VGAAGDADGGSSYNDDKCDSGNNIFCCYVRLLHDSLFLRTRAAARHEVYFFSFFLVFEPFFVSIAEFVTLLQLNEQDLQDVYSSVPF
jgi:hypothetical protein